MMTDDLTPESGEQQADSKEKKESPITRLKNWLLDSYNGLFKIVLQPQLPTLRFMLLAGLAFLLGMIWAYNVAPIQFFNAAPHQLGPDARDQWIVFVANSYPDVYSDATTIDLLSRVEDPLGTVDRLIAGQDSSQPTEVAINLQNIRPLAEQAQPGTSAPSGGGIISSILTFIVAIIIYLIIINVFAIAWGLLIGGIVQRNFIRLRKMIRGETEDDKAARIEMEAIRKTKALQEQLRAEVSTGGEYGDPILQRISPYQKGRAYDDSFAIEDNNDVFLGECGATIAKSIGDNELAAVEIWLFDKEDFVRTLTKLFVSEHIFNDPVSRSELENRVENPQTDIVLLTQDATIQIETDQILVQAKIADLEIGTDPNLPPNSHFAALTIRMEAWEKASAAGGAAPAPVPVPAPASSAGLPSLDSYEIGPPPPMPTGNNPTQPSTPPPSSAGLPSLDSYEIGPPPPMPTGTNPPPTSAPAPPPPSAPLPGQEGDDDDEDPFGGTADFTPIGR